MYLTSNDTAGGANQGLAPGTAAEGSGREEVRALQLCLTFTPSPSLPGPRSALSIHTVSPSSQLFSLLLSQPFLSCSPYLLNASPVVANTSQGHSPCLLPAANKIKPNGRRFFKDWIIPLGGPVQRQRGRSCMLEGVYMGAADGSGMGMHGDTR